MTLRTWATPLITATFVVTAVSGVMLFFHMRSSLITFSHIWLGLAMLAAVVAHLWLNWRPFLMYLKRPIPAAIMASGLVIVALSFMPLNGAQGAGEEGHGPGASMRQVMSAMGNARVETLAELSGKTPEAVIAALEA
ncbi:DUF4405 domain-containing protein, partial [Phaeovulum sp.]|uniref:DUF4405 domain-containing protein n=1 Tax=Phaeovulum sp. TaxID=2934796 RepID=UPI003564E407